MRRFFQFRLRTLFVVTALAAMACVAVVPLIQRYMATRVWSVSPRDYRGYPAVYVEWPEDAPKDRP